LNKKKAKRFYAKGKPKEFSLHELVMRRDYTPESPLHPIFVGPLRIMELHDQGALLKDPRTGELLSVHFQNIRKLTVDEFITLMPSNFDADILQTLKLNRYNKQTEPDSIVMQGPETTEDKQLDNSKLFDNMETANPNIRKLRSGKQVKINCASLPPKYKINVNSASWIPNTSGSEANMRNSQKKPIIKSTLPVQPTPYANSHQSFQNDCWIFNSASEINPFRLPSRNYKKRIKSSFSSSHTGTLVIRLCHPKETSRKVNFDRIIVHFFDADQ
jgi:hypothetical protein